MEDIDALKRQIRLAAVNSIPKAFLEEIIKRTRLAYDDCFTSVSTDSLTLSEQKPAKLKDDRFYRMERELNQTARKHGLSVTAKALPENTHHFVYAVSGVFGLTQSYVQTIGEMPNPAKFRENLASAAAIPMLPLEEPAEIFAPRQFYGLIAHNPRGKSFDRDMQKLGSIQLCVPFTEMKGWADQISLNELLALYPADAVKEKVAGRGPMWKSVPKTGESGDI